MRISRQGRARAPVRWEMCGSGLPCRDMELMASMHRIARYVGTR